MIEKELFQLQRGLWWSRIALEILVKEWQWKISKRYLGDTRACLLGTCSGDANERLIVGALSRTSGKSQYLSIRHEFPFTVITRLLQKPWPSKPQHGPLDLPTTC